MHEKEVFFQCPYCWESISMVVDPSVGGQSYIEDCEVCCRPISIRYEVHEGLISSINATKS